MRTPSTTIFSPPAPRGWRAVTATLLTAFVLAAWAPAAWAHAAFVSANPVPASGITTAPEAVTLTFNQAVTVAYSTINVVHAGGTSTNKGDPTADGATVTQPIGTLSPGQYTVSYRVVSADGHPISGQFAFFYAPHDDQTATPTPTAAPASASASMTPSTAPPAASEDSGSTNWFVAVLISAAVVAIGLVLFLTRQRRQHQP